LKKAQPILMKFLHCQSLTEPTSQRKTNCQKGGAVRVTWATF